jgi:hypothetical protein
MVIEEGGGGQGTGYGENNDELRIMNYECQGLELKGTIMTASPQALARGFFSLRRAPWAFEL